MNKDKFLEEYSESYFYKINWSTYYAELDKCIILITVDKAEYNVATGAEIVGRMNNVSVKRYNEDDN